MAPGVLRNIFIMIITVEIDKRELHILHGNKPIKLMQKENDIQLSLDATTTEQEIVHLTSPHYLLAPWFFQLET